MGKIDFPPGRESPPHQIPNPCGLCRYCQRRCVACSSQARGTSFDSLIPKLAPSLGAGPYLAAFKDRPGDILFGLKVYARRHSLSSGASCGSLRETWPPTTRSKPKGRYQMGIFDAFRKREPKMVEPKRIDSKREVASLLEILKRSRTVGTSIMDRHGALDKIVEIGAPAVDPLIEALRSEYDPVARWVSAEALGRIGDGRAVNPLIATLAHDGHPDVRWHAADALGTLGDGRAIEGLTAALTDKDSWVRDFAKKSLETIKAKTKEG